MKMASVDTMHIPQSRYINCAAQFHRNVRQLMCMWISRELHSQDAVCENCFMILQECIQTGDSVRGFGHWNICISCGTLEQVCMAISACWLRASRAVRRNREQDEIRDMKIQPLDVEHSSNFPQPPPMPMAVTPATQRSTNNYYV